MALNPSYTLLNEHYRILRLVGHGGFGFVYEAQDTHLGEQVAIKELIPGLVGDEATLKRFLAEARATIRLRHERIVGTHHIFPEAGNYYIVMEYLPGGSLEDRLRERGPLPLEDALRVAADVCEGLACAHKEGIVHCDLKPANILFDASDRAKVADFGVAHVSGEMLTRSWHTPAGFVAGTLPYMSPEQTDGVRDDPRLDLYALGAVLYRALTGRIYLDFDPQETPRAQAQNVARICDESPLPPSRHNRKVPAWLDGVVLCALAKRPEERYASADQMRAALLGQGGPQAATSLNAATPGPARPQPTPPPPAGSRTAPPTNRRASLPAWFWPAAGGAAALLVVLVIAIGAALGGRDGTETAVPRATQTTLAAAATTAPVPAPTHTPFSSSVPDGTDTPHPTATASSRPIPTTTLAPAVTLTPKASQAAETQTRPKDSMVMVYVPAGEFTMGSNDGEDDEKPVHTVTLDAFWMDRTEVSNAQFRKCVEEGACQAPTKCDWGDPTYDDTSKADHPVVCVDGNSAKAYCEWAGARLPTEAEWEKAARGIDGRIYPWGNDAPDCNKAQYDSCDGQTVPVGSKVAGASPYGALDMAGNVWEWVGDWYDSGYYGRSPTNNPKGPDSGGHRVMRGGSWYFNTNYVRAADRDNNNPSGHFSVIGFRCVAAGPGG